LELEIRLKRLESKIIPTETIPEHHSDLDQCISSLGLIPDKVRELAHINGSSLAEATSEMLGLDFREFRQVLHEAAYPGYKR
jgi:hypothetical protein